MIPKISFCDFMKRNVAHSPGLTYKWRLARGDLAGFEDELALGVWGETLVQQQHPGTVRGTGRSSCSQSSKSAPTVPNVAHLNAEGELVA